MKMETIYRVLPVKIFAVLGVAAGLLLTGCSAPRGLAHNPSVPQPVVDAGQDEVQKTFAQDASTLAVGSTALFDKTPVGTSQVTAVSQYMNGLGERCTKLELKTQTATHRAGVCFGADGVWRYVPLSN